MTESSSLVLSSSLKWTACILTVLALAMPVSASGPPGTVGDTVQETLDAAADAAEHLADQLIPPGDPLPAGSPAAGLLGDLTTAADQTRERAEAAAEDVQDSLDPDALRNTIDDALRPVHDNLGDAQRQVEDLLGEKDSESRTEPMDVQTQSSINQAMPGLNEPVLLLGAAVLGLGIILWFVGQSATIGAGAAGTAALRDGRKFLPYASPMFTRFEKDSVLGHPKREAIYGTIIGTPGITLQDLCEQSGLSRTAVTHHLRLLEHQHLIVSKRVGRSRHFFENGGRYGRHQKDAYAVLHNDRSKDIHDFIQSNPGAIQKDLCAKFEIQASVAHWHVKRLLEANLLEAVRHGRTVSYFPCADVSTPAYA